jgi:biopolymer transport protein ExbD
MSMSAEINITNLVDVAFVLLIIFMITAPILQGGIEVQLPEAEATPLTTNEAVVVSVDERGDVYVEKTRIASMDELETVLGAFVSGDQKKPVMLNGDRRVVYGRVMEVMGLIKKMGIEDVGLAVVEPPRRR